MNQNMQKMLLKKFHLTNLASPMFRNDDIIKNGLPKKYLPKTIKFQRNLLKSKKLVGTRWRWWSTKAPSHSQAR